MSGSRSPLDLKKGDRVLIVGYGFGTVTHVFQKGTYKYAVTLDQSDELASVVMMVDEFGREYGNQSYSVCFSVTNPLISNLVKAYGGELPEDGEKKKPILSSKKSKGNKKE